MEKEIGSVLCATTLVSWNLVLISSLMLVACLQEKSFLFFFFLCRSLPIKIISVVVYVFFFFSETWSVLQLFPLYYFLLKS